MPTFVGKKRFYGQPYPNCTRRVSSGLSCTSTSHAHPDAGALCFSRSLSNPYAARLESRYCVIIKLERRPREVVATQLFSIEIITIKIKNISKMRTWTLALRRRPPCPPPPTAEVSLDSGYTLRRVHHVFPARVVPWGHGRPRLPPRNRCAFLGGRGVAEHAPRIHDPDRYRQAVACRSLRAKKHRSTLPPPRPAHVRISVAANAPDSRCLGTSRLCDTSAAGHLQEACRPDVSFDLRGRRSESPGDVDFKRMLDDRVGAGRAEFIAYMAGLRTIALLARVCLLVALNAI